MQDEAGSTAGAAQRRQIGAGVDAVLPTSEPEKTRYRENREWRISPKQYLYRYLVAAGIDGKNVLDFGCGTGEVTTQIATLGAHVTGLDVLTDLVEVARRRAELDGCVGRCDFMIGAIGQVALEPESFDFVVCVAVLHHVDLRTTLPALMTCLKPGGSLLVSEPIALSESLQKLRDVTPVSKGDLDPGERQLTAPDLDYIKSQVEVVAVEYFRVFERLSRLVPSAWRMLSLLDRALLWAFPFIRRYAGSIVVIGKKPMAASV